MIKLFDHIQLKKYAIAKQLNIRTDRIDLLWEKLKYSYMQLFNYYSDNRILSINNYQILFIKYFDNQINSIVKRKIQIFDQKVRLSTLSKRIQHHLYRLQNPTNCSQNIRKLVCYLDKQCGFGCQIHHLSYCFIVAYATHRTLLLYDDGNNWQYSINGWQSIFQPLSNTCRYNHLSKVMIIN
jgi:glycoprotein 6-alpha-L-fucosyltransferase